MQSSGISSRETGQVQPSPSTSTLTRKRYALTGRSHRFDPRTDAARGDLTDLRLAERVFAPHYAVATVRTATVRTPLLNAVGGTAVSEVLQGEDFEVLEISAGHAWGISPVDGAVGFVAVDALGAPVRATYVICASVAHGLPMGTRLSDDAGFKGGGANPLESPVADFVALGEALVGVPEHPGGRSGAGVDSDGLIFLILSLAGIRPPRFRDLQAEALGHEIGPEAPLLRGDLIFFANHAAIVVDDGDVIHVADGAVARAPIETVTGGTFGAVAARRRLP